MTQAYPLRWPQGRPRKPAGQRKRALFSKKTAYRSEHTGNTYSRTVDLSVADAVKRVVAEADRMGAHGLVISTNLQLRNDGLPRSGQPQPQDPGVCAYFNMAGKGRALPCDTFDTVEGNIAAIAAHMAATRAVERYGVATTAEMFDGFTALPAPDAVKPKRTWWQVLTVTPDATRLMIEYAYRELAKTRHPDRGGSDEAMAELNAARDEGLAAQEGKR